MKGIKWKQLRARHIFLDEKKNIKFIDFGLSNKTNIFSSLIFYFAPFKFNNFIYNLQLNTFFSLIIMIIKKKYFNIYKNQRKLDLHIQHLNFRHKLNLKRTA